MKHRIGKIVKPSKEDKLSPEKLDEYIKSQGWENVDNAVINGYLWVQYLSSHDYKNVYLRDVVDSMGPIIEQIIQQLSPGCTCDNCKFFCMEIVPVLSWDERVKVLMDTHKLDEGTAGFLATNRTEMFEQRECGTWGKCKSQDVPQLRDIPMKGDSFGCIFYKRKSKK